MTGIEGERPRGELTSQQNKPEHTQPLQGRAEGKQSLQGPTTFDGHEPDAWQSSPDLFKSRTIEWMKALCKEVEGALESSDRVARIIREERAKNSGLESFLTEHEEGTEFYYRGLRDAFNLIEAHLQGKRKPEVPRKWPTVEHVPRPPRQPVKSPRDSNLFKK